MATARLHRCGDWRSTLLDTYLDDLAGRNVTKPSQYAGLELLERYLRTRRFNQLVREAFADLPRGGDFGVVVMVRVFVGLVIVGGRRLRHLAYVADDPIFQRFGNVRVVPPARTLSRWLRHFTMRTVTRFQALNAAVVRQLLPTLGLRTWTVDVDGVVVSTGLQVERAARGYNPHQRKVPSYYPIMAHLAETTHILRVKNRRATSTMGRRACRSCGPGTKGRRSRYLFPFATITTMAIVNLPTSC